MKQMATVSLSILAFLSVSCFPYRGSAQLPIPTDPVVFIDSDTSAHLERVLIIPRYSSSTGVSTGAGHGPSGDQDRCYLADPFTYERGSPFSPRQPKSRGLIWGPGWMFTGKGISLDGVTVMAPGYRPIWVWDLWQATSRMHPVRLSRASSFDSVRETLELLQQRTLTGPETRQFGYCGGEIEVRFSEDDIAMIANLLRAES